MSAAFGAQHSQVASPARRGPLDLLPPHRHDPAPRPSSPPLPPSSNFSLRLRSRLPATPLCKRSIAGSADGGNSIHQGTRLDNTRLLTSPANSRWHSLSASALAAMPAVLEPALARRQDEYKCDHSMPTLTALAVLNSDVKATSGASFHGVCFKWTRLC